MATKKTSPGTEPQPMKPIKGTQSKPLPPGTQGKALPMVKGTQGTALTGLYMREASGSPADGTQTLKLEMVPGKKDHIKAGEMRRMNVRLDKAKVKGKTVLKLSLEG